MPLSSAADGSGLLNRTLKKLHYAVANVAEANSTVAGNDVVVTYDASDNYEPKYSTVDQLVLSDSSVVLTNLDLGASGTAGTLDIFPATASKGKLAVSVTDQTGDTTVSLAIGAMGAARTVTLRDPGAAASILTTTDSTAAATDATAVEITRAADVSGRLVAGGSALTVTEAAHEGRIIKLDTAAGTTCTLPAASGSGGRYRFHITTVATSNSHIIKVANASDTMVGVILSISDDAGNTVKPFFAAGTDDTITLNRTTTGSTRVGEWVELVDAAANLWQVFGCIAATGTEATPFSATV